MLRLLWCGEEKQMFFKGNNLENYELNLTQNLHEVGSLLFKTSSLRLNYVGLT